MQFARVAYVDEPVAPFVRGVDVAVTDIMYGGTLRVCSVRHAAADTRCQLETGFTWCSVDNAGGECAQKCALRRWRRLKVGCDKVRHFLWVKNK